MSSYRLSWPICLLAVFLMVSSAEAKIELIGKEGKLIKANGLDWRVDIDGSAKFSYNQLGRVVTLDSGDSHDFQNYMGYIYKTGLGVKYGDDYEGYIQFRSLGASNYNGILISDGKVGTAFGTVGSNVGMQLLPALREWWVTAPVPNPFSYPVRVKGGLFKYSVGNELALCGDYEEYGCKFYHEGDYVDWNFIFSVPDLENRLRVGPRRREDQKAGFKYNSEAYFWAGDTTVKLKPFSFQPYLGFLLDMTKSDRRRNVFITPVDRDLLGTFGGDINLDLGDLNLGFEAAFNFGEAKSKDSTLPDIEHKGFFIYADGAYNFKNFITPRGRVVYMPGERYTGEDVINGQIDRSSSHDFSVFSPTNGNLTDSHYPLSFGPRLFCGQCDALNYGVLHPNTFDDPYLLNNMIMPNVGVDVQLTKKILFSMDYWYMRSDKHAIGTRWNDGEQNFIPFALPTDLGHELDWEGEYEVNDNITLGVCAAYFMPGYYFRQIRDDGDPLGVNAAPRYDGDADNAWQIEMTFEYRF
ncbi:MAG: hypothetical protein PHE61_02005 [Candidatus Omnitrophica bacterium]|nr:hypothetical protein [Candidatus Omnitrophota bacterium]